MTTIKNIYSQYKLLVNCCLLIIFAWAVNLLLLVGDTTGRGTFGDMFGGLNALFTGLAFATLIYTAWMQKEELALQREELAATRDELKGQKEQLQKQTDTFNIQLFESSLFALINVHKENLNNVTFGEKQGVRAFYTYYDRLINRLTNEYGVHELTRLQQGYEAYYKNYDMFLGHYYRHLYQTLKFIHQSSVDRKVWYASIVMAQLSWMEEMLLFYHALGRDTYPDFKVILEDLSAFQSMTRDDFFKDEYFEFYRGSAFTVELPMQIEIQ